MLSYVIALALGIVWIERQQEFVTMDELIPTHEERRRSNAGDAIACGEFHRGVRQAEKFGAFGGGLLRPVFIWPPPLEQDLLLPFLAEPELRFGSELFVAPIFAFDGDDHHGK